MTVRVIPLYERLKNIIVHIHRRCRSFTLGIIDETFPIDPIAFMAFMFIPIKLIVLVMKNILEFSVSLHHLLLFITESIFRLCVHYSVLCSVVEIPKTHSFHGK